MKNKFKIGDLVCTVDEQKEYWVDIFEGMSAGEELSVVCEVTRINLGKSGTDVEVLLSTNLRVLNQEAWLRFATEEEIDEHRIKKMFRD